MKITRTLQATPETRLDLINLDYNFKLTRFIRKDLWQRLGGLGAICPNVVKVKRCGLLNKKLNAEQIYNNLQLDGTLRSETTLDIINDILMYKEAAKAKVVQDIQKRTKDKKERAELKKMLDNDTFLENSYLSRRMRKHFKHGKASAKCNFIVWSKYHTEEIIDGKLVINIRISKKYHENIRIVTTSNGKNVNLEKCNLRIIKNDLGVIEIHTCVKLETHACGEGIVGLDKGIRIGLTDSNGNQHLKDFGKIEKEAQDKELKASKVRGRLHAYVRKLKEKGLYDKANRIIQNNLGSMKRNRQRAKLKNVLRDLTCKGLHNICDFNNVIVSEDLTWVSKSSKSSKGTKFNRMVSSWHKGILKDSIESVCKKRGAKHHVVNAAYTSQMDSQTGLLEGRRVGAKFYHVNGGISDADFNAAVNIRNRLGDKRIKKFMPWKEVKGLLKISDRQLECCVADTGPAIA